MKKLASIVAYVAVCVLSGCGPGFEGEEINSNTSTVATPKKPKKSSAPPPSMPEVDESGTVHALTLAGDLGSRVGSPVATYNSISTASNQWYVSCNAGTSRDVAYVWTVPATGSYRIGTARSNFDTVLQVRNYKNTAEILGCNDDNEGTGTLQSRLDFNLTQGMVLLIIVEGYDYGDYAEYGDYLSLNIARN